MPCMWKSDVKCFLGHINMPYCLSFLVFAAAITAFALISASTLGLTAPLQKSRCRPCSHILVAHAHVKFIMQRFSACAKGRVQFFLQTRAVGYTIYCWPDFTKMSPYATVV